MGDFEAAARIAGGYLLGAVPFSLLLGFAIGGVDLRRRGSGNVGATNLGRVLGWRYFPLAFALDFAKGLGPPLLLAPGPSDGTELWRLIVTCLLALAPILGHVFSPFLGFRGGKGVATGAGAMVALLPLEAGIAFGVWAIVFGITRTVGVASSAAAMALPAALFAVHEVAWPRTAVLGAVCTLVAGLVLYRHRANLAAYFGRHETR